VSLQGARGKESLDANCRLKAAGNWDVSDAMRACPDAGCYLSMQPTFSMQLIQAFRSHCFATLAVQSRMTSTSAVEQSNKSWLQPNWQSSTGNPQVLNSLQTYWHTCWML